jgi:NAD(P)-dependent dehydrogenase (short-subunit alcohol dehydrogenase family)
MVVKQFDLSGKVSIVTGATKGLGYGMAKALAQAGSDIVVVSRTPAECETVAAEIEGMGRRALAVPTDIANLDSINKLVDTVVEKMNKIDILVNNAGTGITKPSLELTEEDWDRVVDVNLKGVFFLAQAVGKQMKKQQFGKIINIASVYGFVAGTNVLPYISSKAGVLMMTKALAVEWARYNIRVNSVSPGYVLTAMNEKELGDPKIQEHFMKRIPLRRLGEVDEIAGAVLYLASDASNYSTGVNIVVDGGISL